ncbi:homoserine kinase [Pseudanabaena sp. FACHB-1998]|uniref:homoserine kinase n=1 Tax=Pseudanabaena sp. FACHB-1998 TaxID=2692858 RepID=UPI00168143A1|nr:homoserine kinase [Pseudanabaena sp. FACHB-1998]MBD2176355.1 homoserine kinase [Pseudanabaena sp. FACHB-1998]
MPVADWSLKHLSTMPDHLFPITYSTLAPEALVDRVLSCFAVGEVTSCVFWMRGLSDIYLVSTRDSRYVLRVSHAHWRSKAEIEFELQLLEFLHRHHIPVAYPLSTYDGKLAIEIKALEGDRYASLFTHAAGQVAVGDLNKVQAQKLGETVAKLHKTSQNFQCHAARPHLTINYLLDDSLRDLSPFFNNGARDYMQEAIAHIKEQIHDLPQELPLWSVCWGDPHSGNVHFTDNNDITLFDFDQCGYGWRSFDIAKFLQVTLQAGISPSVRKAFLHGYQSTQPLEEIELKCMQPLMQAAQIWSWAISVKSAIVHNHSKLDHSYFHQRLEHFKMLRSPDWKPF